MTDTATTTEAPPPADGPVKLPDTEPAAAPSSADEPKPKPKPARDRKPRSARKGPGRPSNKDKRREAVADQLTAIGYAVAGVGMVTEQPALGADGEAVINHAENIATALADLAETNDRVARLVDGGTGGSAWIGVAVAVGALGRDVAANHGLIGPGLALDPGDLDPGGDVPRGTTSAADALARLREAREQ